jgi:hypothetical protein
MKTTLKQLFDFLIIHPSVIPATGVLVTVIYSLYVTREISCLLALAFLPLFASQQVMPPEEREEYEVTDAPEDEAWATDNKIGFSADVK